MSNLSDFIGGGAGKLRYQEFLTSGTFVPSAKLLANGGQVFVDLRGGGGAGGGPTWGASGGSSKHVTHYTVTGNTSVVIGAGGTYTGNTGGAGGTSSFGTLSVPGGGGGAYNTSAGINLGGKGSGNEGKAGQTMFYGVNSFYSNSQAVSFPSDSDMANSGIGGGAGEAGKAGYCRVWWYE